MTATMFGIGDRRRRTTARRAFVEGQVTASLAEQRRCLALAADTMTSQAYRDAHDPEAQREMCSMISRARDARGQVDAYLDEWSTLTTALVDAGRPAR